MTKVSEITSKAIADIIEYYKPAGGKIDQMEADVAELSGKVDENIAQLAVKANQADLNSTIANVSANAAAIVAKADTSYVNTQISTIGNASPKAVYTSLSALQAAFPTGTTGIYVVTADGKWYYWNGSAWTAGGVYQSTGIPDYSLVSRNFKNPLIAGIASKNLFDLTDINPGFYVSYANGTLISNANYSASNYIPVSANAAYSISATTEQLAWYDTNKVFISGVGTTGANMVSPANAAYVRLSMLNTQVSTIQFEAGSVKTSYESFNPKIDNSLLKPNSVKVTNIPAGEITPDRLSFFPLTGIKSKNLFDKSKVTANMYVVNQTGQLATSPNGTHNASEWIAVQPSTNYRISGTSEQGAFYDAGKNYVSGYTNASSVTASPANAYYVRITALASQLDAVQLEQGATASSYAPAGVSLDLNSIKTPIGEDKLSLGSNIIRGALSKNLFNKATVIAGYYVANSTGGIGVLAGYNASDYIPILPNTSYRLSGTSEQLAFYDTNKTYISGLVYGDQLGVTPANAYFVRLTVKDIQLSSTQLEQGTVATSYVGYGARINADQVSFNVPDVQHITKTVKPDASGDYTSPKLANDAITDASSSKIYDVIVYPGTYTEIGWTLKPYINLIGTDKKTCLLRGSQPDNSDDNTISNTSTIWMNDTNALQNLTITAQNMRYAVHDESSNSKKDWTRNLINCHIEHYGNEGAKTWRNNNPASGLSASTVWASACAYGMGHSSGAVLTAEDCTFKAKFAPFSVHNNTNFTNPCKVHLKRCKITKVNGDFDYGLRVQSLGSGTDDRIILEGCQMNAPIMHNDSPWLGDGTATTHLDFTIEGFGNSTVPYQSSFATNEVDRPNFTDEYNRFTAQSAITKGQAVCFVSDYKTVKPMTNADDVSLFAGIAIENIASGDVGLVKTKGFVAKADLYNFTAAITFGTKYGVSAEGSLIASSNAVILGFDANNVKII